MESMINNLFKLVAPLMKSRVEKCKPKIDLLTFEIAQYKDIMSNANLYNMGHVLDNYYFKLKDAETKRDKLMDFVNKWEVTK